MYSSATFISRRNVEAINDPDLKDQKILISISSPPTTKGCRPAKLHDCWHAVLRLEFHDVDPNSCSARKKVPTVLFSEEQALRVLSFLREHEAQGREVWVNCEAGISRSAAVAKFTAQLYGLEFPERYSLYNRHVFSTLLHLYGKCTYGEGPITPEALPGLQLQGQ